ncbi:hypothetical protein KIL84_010496 [Mauremys mutica]|uniref:Uncharacterized protein n=1 Tax=Mauremys mutica TaxID=74926 RepID=A0A9D3XA81_9SAUR|nr:hypothetical protein KIL84_010496 [Mauremys mutica]
MLEYPHTTPSEKRGWGKFGMCRAAVARERGDFPKLQGCGCWGETPPLLHTPPASGLPQCRRAGETPPHTLLPSPSSVAAVAGETPYFPALARGLPRWGREGTYITLER